MSKKPENKDFNVWICKIVVPAGSELPPAFDTPPRIAATSAVENAGIEVLCCISGWGEELTQEEIDSMPKINGANDVYYAGVMDTDDSVIN